MFRSSDHPLGATFFLVKVILKSAGVCDVLRN